MKQNSNVKPCVLCAMRSGINVRDVDGSVCVWYNVYMSFDDAANKESSLRKACIRDGNNFVWRLRGMRPLEAFQLMKERTDWSMMRKSVSTSRIVSLISVGIAALSLVVTLAMA